MNINIQCLRSGTTALAAAVVLAAGVASACGAEPGRKLAGAVAGTGGGIGVGQVGTLGEVPWRSVGPGWALVEYSASTVPGVKPAVSGPTTLYLVDPRGGRYQVYRWPAGGPLAPQPQLVDWSGDKTRALVIQPEPRSSWRLEQIRLATGKVSAIKVARNEMVTGYTKPDGLNLLATLGLQAKIVRLDLSGRVQAVLAKGRNLSAVQSPDGTTLAVSATGGLTLVSNAGGVIRQLPVPGGAGANGCTPIRWWDASTVLAGCMAKGNPVNRLWLIPAGGGAPTALTRPHGNHGVDPYGDVGAWQLPSGLYVQALGPCGTVFIARRAADGSLHVVNIPGTTGNNSRIVTAYQSRMLVQAQTECEGSNSLLWFDPASRAVQMVLRAPKDVIGASDEVPYGRLGG